MPADGDWQAEVEALLPDVRCFAGRGRIGCDPERELLCLWEPRRVQGDARLGCGSWSALCAVSELEGVAAIRGTFFE